MGSKALVDRIQLELNGREHDQVYDLTLDNCKVATFDGFPQPLNKLRVMSAINMGLKNLDGLPNLPELTTVDLSDNKISDFDQLVEKCPNIEHLNLCGNAVKTIDALKPLQKLSKLATLDLFTNEVTRLPNYREDVFVLLPQVKYLDGFDINNIELEISGDEGEDHEDAFDSDISGESGEDFEDEEEEGVGLSYLQSSKALQDEDESEDYEARAQNGDAADAINTSASASQNNGKRGTKRKHESDNAGPDTEH
uniref:Acidic leucine-rich nuclear phosphoprotein 32 family member A n=1 Tax=Acrobeloides nanus TaxID=290746 RepID=A0A914D809_9BILA